MQNTSRQGFTLIELLVVLVIVAIAVGGVLMALPDNRANGLDDDAQRLAAVMEIARAKSQASGTPIKLVLSQKGFVLEGLKPSSDVASEYVWKTQGLTAAYLPREKTGIVLGPDPIIGAQAVVLSLPDDGGKTEFVATDGISPFKVAKRNPFTP